MKATILLLFLATTLPWPLHGADTVPSGTRTTISDAVADVLPKIHLPAETAGWDRVVAALISSFEDVDVVALADAHGRRVDSELRLRLIRHPDFAKKVRTIVVEFGNSLYQPILDRYVDGEDVSSAEVQQVWRNVTGVGSKDSPVYADFFAAVREVNQTLSPEKRLRVIAGDPPIDWGKVKVRSDFHEFGDGDRRDFPVSLDRIAVNPSEKALVIYGSTHISRPRFPLWAAGREPIASKTLGTFRAIQVASPARVLVVETLAGANPSYEKLEQELHTRERPVLFSLRTPSLADLTLEGTGKVNGQPKIFQVRLGRRFDACIYFGNTAEAEEFLEPDPAIYRDTPYGEEIARRRKIMELRPAR